MQTRGHRTCLQVSHSNAPPQCRELTTSVTLNAHVHALVPASDELTPLFLGADASASKRTFTHACDTRHWTGSLFRRLLYRRHFCRGGAKCVLGPRPRVLHLPLGEKQTRRSSSMCGYLKHHRPTCEGSSVPPCWMAPAWRRNHEAPSHKLVAAMFASRNPS